MLKQLLLDELNRLTNTHEVIEEKAVYVESLRKVINELTANRDHLERVFEIKQVQDEFIAQKSENSSDDMVNFVLSRLPGVVLFEMTWLLKTKSKKRS